MSKASTGGGNLMFLWHLLVSRCHDIYLPKHEAMLSWEQSIAHMKMPFTRMNLILRMWGAGGWGLFCFRWLVPHLWAILAPRHLSPYFWQQTSVLRAGMEDTTVERIQWTATSQTLSFHPNKFRRLRQLLWQHRFELRPLDYSVYLQGSWF